MGFEVNKMRKLVFFLTIGLIICSGSAKADIYSWIDRDGVKRFSNRPPNGDINNIQTMKEIPYDEEAAALRKAMEKEWEEERLAEEEKQYWENIQNQYMQDRMLLENRLRETERQSMVAGSDSYCLTCSWMRTILNYME